MRSVALLYRILLPPILLFRFCSPRPPETTSSSRTTDERFRVVVRNSDSENNLRGNFSATFLNRNEATDILRKNYVKLENLNRDTGFPRRRTEIQRNEQPSLKTFLNFTKRRVDLLPQGDVNHVAIKNKTFQFSRPTYSSFFSDVAINEHKNVDKHKLSRSGHSFDSKVKHKFLAKINKLRNNSNQQRVENVQSSKVDWVPHSSNRDNGQVTSLKARERRDINGKLSNDFKSSSSRGTPPEYLVQLYQLLSGTHYEALRNFVATGFVNINKDAGNRGETSLTHSLAFNVSLSHERETVHYAELRLYFFITRRRPRAQILTDGTGYHEGQKYLIKVFETQQHGLERHQIAFHTVVDPDNIWLSLNVTSAVQNWAYSGLRTLEVSYSVVSTNCTNADLKHNNSVTDSADSNPDHLVLNLNNENNKGPFLVIFSRKHETPTNVTVKRARRDTTGHQKYANKSSKINDKLRNNNDTNYKINENLSNSNYFQGLVEFISIVNNDSLNHDENNELTSLKNNVLSIKPVYEQNRSTGEESEQLNKEEVNSTFLNDVSTFQRTTNSSALIRSFQRRNFESNTSTMNSLLPGLKIYRSLKGYNQSKTLLFAGGNVKGGDVNKMMMAGENGKRGDVNRMNVMAGENGERDDVNRMNVRRAAKVRFRRHLASVLKQGTSGSRQKRSRKKRNSCQRNEMYVDFETIKWDKVIIYPRGYQAFECAGKCHTPISEYLTPTKHAIIQTLIHTSYPDQASRACCVPTKLDPISILYWDETDIKYDYTYEGMVVAECGCR